jgi:hypothetical protein
VLLTARSIIVQASAALDHGNPPLDQVVWQQACYAAVVLGTSMDERGDFGSDRDLVEETFQSFQRLRCQHPTYPQLEVATAKLQGLLHPENLTETFAKPFPLSQASTVEPSTVADAESAFLPLANPYFEGRQQIRPTVVTGHLPSQQKVSTSSKQKTRRRLPILLEACAMDIPNAIILPSPTLHAIPSIPAAPIQPTPRFETPSAWPLEPYHSPLADITLASSALIESPQVRAQNPNRTGPLLYVNQSIEEPKPVPQEQPFVAPLSAPLTFMNQDDIDAGPMTGQMDYLQYPPPLNPSYFLRETRHADDTLASCPTQSVFLDAQSLVYTSATLPLAALQQSLVDNAPQMDSFLSDSTQVGVGPYNSEYIVAYMAQEKL